MISRKNTTPHKIPDEKFVRKIQDEKLGPSVRNASFTVFPYEIAVALAIYFGAAHLRLNVPAQIRDSSNPFFTTTNSRIGTSVGRSHEFDAPPVSTCVFVCSCMLLSHLLCTPASIPAVYVRNTSRGHTVGGACLDFIARRVSQFRSLEIYFFCRIS